MEQTIFRSPRTIIKGNGSILKAGIEAKKYGKKVMVVTSRSSTKKSGALDKVCTALKEEGLGYIIFDEVESDPSVHTVTKGAELCRAENVEVIVAIGGGSPLDAAKGIAIVASNGGDIRDYEKQGLKTDALPIVAIPTTAGTGSEVTRFTVITDTETKIKMLIAADSIVPQTAILDPELTVTMPKEVTAATGMDALTHAIEAYISKLATPMSSLFALEAIELIAANIIPAVCNPDHMEARANMLYGQMYAGLAFSNASVALVHAMSRPLGAHFGVPHGVANAILLPTVMSYNRCSAVEKMKDVAVAMGEVVEGISVREASYTVIDVIDELFAQTGLEGRLSAYNIPEEALELLAQDAYNSGSRLNNPRIATQAEILELYKSIY
jgi:1,3-propanediol dehydrogenase/alcohol dehydrogenase